MRPAQADYINTDHLEALRDFLLRNDPQPTQLHVTWESTAGGGR